MEELMLTHDRHWLTTEVTKRDAPDARTRPCWLHLETIQLRTLAPLIRDLEQSIMVPGPLITAKSPPKLYVSSEGVKGHWQRQFFLPHEQCSWVTKTLAALSHPGATLIQEPTRLKVSPDTRSSLSKGPCNFGFATECIWNLYIFGLVLMPIQWCWGLIPASALRGTPGHV